MTDDSLVNAVNRVADKLDKIVGLLEDLLEPTKSEDPVPGSLISIPDLGQQTMGDDPK